MVNPPVKTIERKTGFQSLGFRELSQYRDLFFFLVWRDIQVLYKQTVLGFGWAILRPVFSMIVFSIVFGKLAKIPSDGVPYPLFSYVALVPWMYFQTAMVASSASLIGGARLISRIYFPRVILPLTPVLAGLVDFVIALSIVGVLMSYYDVAPTWNIVVLPLLILIMALFAAGIGIWLSALAAQYRDVKFAMPFIGQLMMYAAPVVWPVSLIPDKYRLLCGLYPMVGVIEGFRAALLGGRPIPWDLITEAIVMSLLVFIVGNYVFRKTERLVADVA